MVLEGIAGATLVIAETTETEESKLVLCALTKSMFPLFRATEVAEVIEKSSLLATISSPGLEIEGIIDETLALGEMVLILDTICEALVYGSRYQWRDS